MRADFERDAEEGILLLDGDIRAVEESFAGFVVCCKRLVSFGSERERKGVGRVKGFAGRGGGQRRKLCNRNLLAVPCELFEYARGVCGKLQRGVAGKRECLFGVGPVEDAEFAVRPDH